MGLFSGKDVTTVGTSVSRVVSDALLPNSIKSGAIKGIFANGDLAEYAMEELTSSIALRAERMYNYAESTYTYGSPSGEIYSSTQGREDVLAVLEAQLGVPVLLDYSHYGPPNKLHAGWMKIVEQYGYDTVTNQFGPLSLQKNTPVYLSNMTVMVPASLFASYEAGALDQWGVPPAAGYKGLQSLPEVVRLQTAHTPVVSSTSIGTVVIRVEYEWIVHNQFFWDGDGYTCGDKVMHGTFDIPITGYDDIADFFHVRYVVDNKPYYWMYQVGLGTYPILDAVFDDPAPVNGQFFPFTYFRYGKNRMNSDKDSAGFKTTSKLVKYLGMDFDAITDTVHENPGIADVEQAMLIMAVPANTSNATERLYLFDFFEQLYYAAPNQFSSAAVARGFFNRVRLDASKNAIVIQDKLFKMALGNDGIYKKRKVGHLGKIGTVTSGIFNESYTEAYTASDNDGGSTTQYRTVIRKFHYYRKQVSDVLYDEVQVMNLKMVYYIWGGYNTVGDDTDAILLIPIDRSISKEYTLVVKEELYARSLHFVFNSRTTTHLKWYQTGFFGDLIKIAAIVIAVISMQPEIAMMAIAVQAGTMTLLAFAWAVTTMYIIPYVLTTLAVKYFIKIVGLELAFLIAIVAAAYGTIQTYLANSMSSMVAGAPWAEQLLSMSGNLIKGVTVAINEAMLDLKAEADLFKVSLDKETKLVDTAEERLNADNRMTTLFIPGEIPTDFFNRTIHAGNIGIQSIEAIGSYVAIALTLPKLADSVGENYV